MARVADTVAGKVLLLAKGVPPQETAAWQAVHAGCFLLGGGTFLLGTGCYYLPAWAEGPAVSAWLYVVGSCGFLGVDALELATYTRTHPGERWLHLNIALACVGSLLYVIGSYGFVPWVAAAQPWLGVWGFLLGSAVIGCSQLWKTARIAREYSRAIPDPGSALEGGVASEGALSQSWAPSANAVGVELSAGLGGWSFFFGTLVYAGGGWAEDARIYWAIIGIWMLGSWLFTQGALFLFYRHAVMKLG
jgi:hypothetical protein